jgi:hypothetical protein
MYLHSFEEELGSGLCSDHLLACGQNHHFIKMINHHKSTNISPLGCWKAKHVVHRDGFPEPFRSRKRGVHALFLNGQFGNSACSERPDILDNIMSMSRLIEMLLQHFHYLFYTEVSCHLTIVIFPNHLHLLT